MFFFIEDLIDHVLSDDWIAPELVSVNLFK